MFGELIHKALEQGRDDGGQQETPAPAKMTSLPLSRTARVRSAIRTIAVAKKATPQTKKMFLQPASAAEVERQPSCAFSNDLPRDHLRSKA